MTTIQSALLFLLVRISSLPVVDGILDGQGPLLMLEPPPRLEFSNNSGGRLDCSARGSPTPNLHWMMADGSPASTVTGLRYQLSNGTLVFPPFSAADFRPDVHHAIYRCVASNSLGRVISRDVRLRAVAMQEYTIDAGSSIVVRGNSAVLRCIVPSFVKDFIKVTSWLQDGNFNIYPSRDGDGKLHMLPTGELVVVNAGSADSYSTYQCRVTHRLSGEPRVSTGVARISVSEAHGLTPPRFSERTLSIEARRDELVVLPCFAEGDPPPEYRWEFGGSLVPEDEQRYTSGGLLIIPRARPHDSGRYTCTASNPAGNSRLDVSLLVSWPLSARVSPALLTAGLGQPAQLTCTTTGHPVTMVLWMKNGQSLSSLRGGMSGEVFHLASVSREDQGMYQCFVKNEKDMAQGTAELRLGDTPPQLVYGFIRQNIQPGPSVSLKCVASGNPTPNIKWTLDGYPLPLNERFVIGQYVPMYGDVISHVNITSVHVQEGGTYQCSAVNRVGEASHSAQLNVYGAPHVRPMGEVSAVAGENLKITCPVAGFPIDGVKWYKGDRELPINRRHLVFPNNTLVIEKVQSGVDNGVYRCDATDKQARTASGTAHVNVMVPPAITPFSFGELSAGERVRVTCSVKRGDGPIAISWLKDASPVMSQGLHDELDLTIQHLEEYSSVLAIRSVSSRHSGNYTCVASNPTRTTMFTAQLLVTVPPTWVVEPQNAAAKLGQQVVLDCKVDGFPKPTISWKKASGQTPGHYHELSTHQLKQQSGGAYLLPNGSLLLETVAQEDEGHYLCEASNGIGVGLSAVVQLTVHAPVHFRVRSRKELVRRGGTAVLSCHALGDQPISLIWRKEGNTVEMSSRTIIKNNSLLEGLVSDLTIKSVRIEDGGIYTCFARNEFGQDQTAMHLLVQDAPALPTNVRVLERTSRRVTIAWTPAQDGNSPITRYVIRYNPMQDSWQGPSEEITAEGSQSNVILTPLRPSTLYSVRVVAENTLGPGAASQELRVRTDEEAPSAPPLHIMVEATSSTQLVLTWEPPPEDQWNGPLLGHYVGHRELGDSESKRQYNFTTVAWRGNGKEECHLNGLKKFYKYGLVVQAFNSKGPGPLAMQVVAQTLEDVPDSSPRDVRCAPLSPESLQVSWQPPPETLVHGVIQGYRLLYEPVPVTEQHDIAEPRTKMTTALKTVLHGLLKFTNYSIELLAFTRVGDGVKSTRAYCQTKEDVPGPPAGIKAVLQDPETALVTWLTPTHPNGVILRYSVHIRVVDGGRQVDVRSISHHSPSHLQYQLPGLKKRLFYEFWITAFTKVGEGQSSPVVSLTPSSKVKASIVSFGGAQLAAWKSDVRLPCRAVGIQELKRQWLVGDAPLNQQPRLNIAPDGSLLLSTVQRSDQGEYTCVVWNEYGKDVITYHLRVQVPPGTPLLLMTESTQHTLQLQWKLGDDGGSPIRGFVLHYKLEHGEWEEARLDGTRSTHVLANLRCGTLYHVYVTAYNRVGSGSPSKTLDVRTRGGLPLLPAPADLLLLNSSSVALRLSIWPDGGCPMLYYVVEYAPRLMEGDNWLVVSNNIVPNRVYVLSGLRPATTYKLRIKAHNAAGSKEGNYQFTTLSLLGGTVSPSHVVTQNDGRAPLHKDVKIVLLCLLSSLIIALGFLGICFCVKKKSREPSPHQSLEDVQANANQDNKHNLARREQYYATVRKLPPSPGTLECIPEYSEDIRPYATFHVPGPQSSESTKLQTFVYRESDASPTVKSVKSEYCRVKKSHQCDEYDSFGSESDTEPGTSSRTESSNQLDDGGHHGDMSRSYHPPVSRLAKPLVNSIYPGPEWSPPAVDPSSSVERRPFQRRYCQTHLPK